MDFLNEWSICICITLICASVLSYLCPRGDNGKLYNSLIKIFILLSFIYPLSIDNFQIPELDYKNVSFSEDKMYVNSSKQIIYSKINDTLKNIGVIGSSVDIKSYVGENDEINIENIIVFVPDEYDVKTIKKCIFDKLSLNVEVVHIGQ